MGTRYHTLGLKLGALSLTRRSADLGMNVVLNCIFNDIRVSKFITIVILLAVHKIYIFTDSVTADLCS
jgi:hypothetical protein